MEDSCRIAFRGRVFSGRGEGAFYVSIYARNFRRTLGFTPYPGTLNIRLERGEVERYNECLGYIPKIVVDPPRIEGVRLARVVVYRVYLNGVPVWAVRPEITVYRDDVVEVINERNLRELLGLKDGDLVYLSFSKEGEE